MTHDELLDLVTSNLDRDGEDWSGKPGAVLYSDLASIRPGRFYLMGMNPGGDPDAPGCPPIRHNLYADRGTNHYADQCWDCAAPNICPHLDPATQRVRPEERQQMQRRVCDLIAALGVKAQKLLSTNLVFHRTRQARDLPNWHEWCNRCWRVHRVLVRQVQPDWIISLGFGPRSAYEFLREGAEQHPIPRNGHPPVG
ncbi:MAG: hypothetical protein JO122_19995 [Acetobacteraceae bacterium]|nr:hypothetical protein [Acetobacteraceae bacterium]